jgi:hypothetical protein
MDKDDYVSGRVKELEVQLDDIEQTAGLKNCVQNIEAERLLGLSESDIDKMTAEECANAKYLLLQHSLVIQKRINRAIAVKNWADRGVTVIIAKTYNNLDKFMTYELKKETCALNDGFASRLREISVEQQQVIDSLNYMGQAITAVANSFQTLFMAKKKVEGHYE